MARPRTGAGFTITQLESMLTSRRQQLDELGRERTKVLKQLATIPDAEGRLVWVTGHSLGGALATLAACPLNALAFNLHNVYTFAAPMVCNHAACSQWDVTFPEKIYRFVFQDDLVPSLPIVEVPNSYAHVQQQVYLSKPKAEDLGEVRKWLDLLLLGAAGLTGLLPVVLQQFHERIRSHSLNDSYLPALRREIRA